jgi:hypothetical protein
MPFLPVDAILGEAAGKKITGSRTPEKMTYPLASHPALVRSR